MNKIDEKKILQETEKIIEDALSVDVITDPRFDIVCVIMQYKYGQLETLKKLGLITIEESYKYQEALRIKARIRVRQLEGEENEK